VLFVIIIQILVMITLNVYVLHCCVFISAVAIIVA